MRPALEDVVRDVGTQPAAVHVAAVSDLSRILSVRVRDIGGRRLELERPNPGGLGAARLRGHLGHIAFQP